MAFWHDEQALAANARSGGLSEQFWLPVFFFAPAIVLAVVGGVFAKATFGLTRAT